jgi:Holliday junction resolvase RusA-like endonuclease
VKEVLVIRVPGKPQAWERAGQLRRRGKPTIHYTPSSTRNYKTAIALVAARAMAGREPSKLPIYLGCTFCLEIPRSWSKREKAAALTEARLPTSRPDLDNFAKGVKDALTGIAYADDAQVVILQLRKVYAAIPSTEIQVREIA